MKENTHVQAIPQDVLTQVEAKVQEVQALLAPYMLALTPEERRELPKTPHHGNHQERGEEPVGRWKRSLWVKKARRFGAEGNRFSKKAKRRG